MVCPRCVATVVSVFKELDIPVESVNLGVVKTKENVTENKTISLSNLLHKNGFEILIDKKDKIVQQIKDEIIYLVHHSGSIPAINLSTHLSDKTGYEYNYLSNLFSEKENITIEKFFIIQRIERAKELLSYKQHTLTEIAHILGYSSTAYLSSQFKKITGLTPTRFIAIGIRREYINNL